VFARFSAVFPFPVRSEAEKLLQYPLHTGARWRLRNDPDLVIEALVEGHEVLELPAGRFPAWRVRILWQIDNPPMDVRVWYGTSGRLRVHYHDEFEGDPDDPGSSKTTATKARFTARSRSTAPVAATSRRPRTPDEGAAATGSSDRISSAVRSVTFPMLPP